MKNQKELSIVKPNWEFLSSVVVFKFFTTILLLLLVSCKEVSQPGGGITPSLPEPFRTSTVTTSTPSLFPTNTFTPTPQKTLTQTPTFIPSVTRFPTPTAWSTDGYNDLAPGQYLILDEGALSLSTNALISPFDHLPSGRISPDGKRTLFVFRGLMRPKDYYYRVIEIATGNQMFIPLLADCDALYPDWSPDGTKIITSCFSTYEMIVQSFPDGKEVSRVRIDEGGDPFVYSIEYAKWSRSGKWVAYIEFDHSPKAAARDKIYIFDSACFDHTPSCKETKRIAAEIETSGWNLIEWASQDRLIILEEAKPRFIIYDANQNTVVRIIPLPSRFGFLSFAVSPDGNKIYFGQRTADEKGSAIYRASLTNGKIDQLYYFAGLRGIDVFDVIEK